MRTKPLLFLMFALPTLPGARATESKPASCCATEKPACCAAEKAGEDALATTSSPVSDRSLYQLDATWIDDAGQRVQLAAFRGRPVVLTMFFASCEYACPMLIADLHRVREALPEAVRRDVRFILVSFDPARDTPARLKTYREQRALDASWKLLHGDAGAVQELAMLLGVKYKQDARGQFAHSNLITVLNAEGEIAYQRSGLQGDAQEPARAIVAAASK